MGKEGREKGKRNNIFEEKMHASISLFFTWPKENPFFLSFYSVSTDIESGEIFAPYGHSDTPPLTMALTMESLSLSLPLAIKAEKELEEKEKKELLLPWHIKIQEQRRKGGMWKGKRFAKHAQ